MPLPYATRPLLLLALSLIALRVEATCYWQNSPVLSVDDPDAIAPDDTACFPDQDNSPCCATGWTCLSDGVCKIKQGDTDFYYRGTCTDRTWNSQQCPGWCFAQNANASIPMSKCDSDQDWYCCPGDADCNCETGKNAVKLGAEQPTTVTVIGSTTWPGFTSTTAAFTAQPLNSEGTSTTDPTTSASDSTGTSVMEAQATTGTGTSDASSASSDSSTSSSSSSNTTALAAGLGGGLGGAAVIGAALGFFFFMRRRRQKRDEATATTAAAAAGVAQKNAYDDDGRSSGSVAAAAGGNGAGMVHEFYGDSVAASRKADGGTVGSGTGQRQQQPAELGSPGNGAVEMGAGEPVRAELP